jgi:hypothetical protein
MTFLMILPMFLLVAGLVGTIAVVIKRNIAAPDNSSYPLSHQERDHV